MSMDELLEMIRSFDGVLELAPDQNSAFPAIAWGDHFIYYAPDGQVPKREQPFATIVTKNYPDDALSDLDAADRWRLNIHVGTDVFTELLGEAPRSEPSTWDYAAADTLLPHPVYRRQGWVSIVNPGASTQVLVVRLLRQAHDVAVRRATRSTNAASSAADGHAD